MFGPYVLCKSLFFLLVMRNKTREFTVCACVQCSRQQSNNKGKKILYQKSPPKISKSITSNFNRLSQSLYCLMSCEDHLRSREKQWASKVTGTAVLCTATYAKGAKKPATRAWPLPSRQWLVPKLLRLLLMFLVSKAYYLPGLTAVLPWFGRSIKRPSI